MTIQTYFQPYTNVITNITNSNPAVVTTYSGHGFHDGLIVRLLIPTQSGMSGINNVSSKISIINLQNFSLDVDTTLLDPFIPPILPIETNQYLSIAVPIGEEALTLSSATTNSGNIIPEL